MWITIKACLYVNKKLNTTSFIPVWEMQPVGSSEELLEYLDKEYYISDLHDVYYNTHSKEIKLPTTINYYEKQNILSVGENVFIEKPRFFKELVKTKISKAMKRISHSYILQYMNSADDYLFVDSGITPVIDEVYQIVIYETVYNIENDGDKLYKRYNFYTIAEE